MSWRDCGTYVMAPDRRPVCSRLRQQASCASGQVPLPKLGLSSSRIQKITRIHRRSQPRTHRVVSVAFEGTDQARWYAKRRVPWCQRASRLLNVNRARPEGKISGVRSKSARAISPGELRNEHQANLYYRPLCNRHRRLLGSRSSSSPR